MATPTSSQVVRAVEQLGSRAVDGGLDEDTTPEQLLADCLRVVYRLVFADLAVRRGGVLDSVEALASLRLGVVDPQVLDHAVVAELVALLEVDAPDEETDPVTALGAVHEEVLSRRPVLVGGELHLETAETRTARKAAGAYFTPEPLVGWLLDHALEPALDEAADPGLVTVCDPSCGAGIFLVAATRRLLVRGVPPTAAVGSVAGVDRDAGALEIARTCLWLELVRPGRAVAMPELALRTGDALLDDHWEALGPAEGFDVVVGNPPFLNQLQRFTAHAAGVAARLNERSRGALRPYTDVSAVFLHRAVERVRPGGRIGLVQPQSLLAARDAAGVRAHLADSCALEAVWASDVPVFAANVITCAPVLRRAAHQMAVRRFHGPAFGELEPLTVPDLRGSWAFLLAEGLGIPAVRLPRDHGVLADIADCTADFRDQYYGLAPYVHEAEDAPAGAVAPLVTSGLIDPARSWWGERTTRFLKRRWDAPVIGLDALRDDTKLHRWASRRLVPKVLVGTQGKVVEAVADEHGTWLPSVPTITVVPDPAELWHVLAVLLAPPVAAEAAAEYAGTALSMRAIKLSASQVGRLPLPGDRGPWDRAAEAVRRAQHEPDLRLQHLVEAASLMCAAYGVDEESLDWWRERVPG